MTNQNNARDSSLPQLTRWGMYILVAIGTDELHGWAIRQEIERLTGGRESPSVATLYETIAKLLDDGLIERAGEKVVGEGKVRKLYRLTGLGARAVNARLEEEHQALTRLRAAAPPALGWA